MKTSSEILKLCNQIAFYAGECEDNDYSTKEELLEELTEVFREAVDRHSSYLSDIIDGKGHKFLVGHVTHHEIYPGEVTNVECAPGHGFTLFAVNQYVLNELGEPTTLLCNVKLLTDTKAYAEETFTSMCEQYLERRKKDQQSLMKELGKVSRDIRRCNRILASRPKNEIL